MGKLNRALNEHDIKYKGLPFECSNCGNKPTTEDVVKHDGDCAICGDSVVAYTIDTAEFITKLTKERDEARKGIITMHMLAYRGSPLPDKEWFAKRSGWDYLYKELATETESE